MGEVLMVARRIPNPKDRVQFFAPMPNKKDILCVEETNLKQKTI